MVAATSAASVLHGIHVGILCKCLLVGGRIKRRFFVENGRGLFPVPRNGDKGCSLTGVSVCRHGTALHLSA